MQVFHPNCSKDIKFSDNYNTAERVGQGYDHGVVFCKQPVDAKQDEIFQLIINDRIEKWAGSLRLGVTTLNPNKGVKFRALSHVFNPASCVDQFWIWSGNKLHQRGKQNLTTINLNSLVVNDIIGIQVRSNGELHVYLHGKHVEMVAKDIPVDKELYFVFDVYGTTKEVTYVPGGWRLKDLCCIQILKMLKYPTDLELLPLPKTLIYYLSKRRDKNYVNSLKRRRSSSSEEEEEDQHLGRVKPS